MPDPLAPATQTAYATSAFSDPQNIASALTLILALLALPEITALIPLRYMPAIAAVSSAAALILRTQFGVRPVAFIAPQQVKPVEVPKLEKTQQGTEDAHK
jgi:hypothetical protein